MKEWANTREKVKPYASSYIDIRMIAETSRTPLDKTRIVKAKHIAFFKGP